MKYKLFISHAVKDNEIANELIRFLEYGMKIPKGRTFCSSVPGKGIPGERRVEPEILGRGAQRGIAPPVEGGMGGHRLDQLFA